MEELKKKKEYHEETIWFLDNVKFYIYTCKVWDVIGWRNLRISTRTWLALVLVVLCVPGFWD